MKMEEGKKNGIARMLLSRKRLVLPLLFLLAGCGGVENTTPLPDAIQQMQLQEVIQGEDADEIIAKMHRNLVADRSNFIGRYRGKDYSATLYLSVYAHADSAVGDLENMTSRIRDPEIGGKMGYQHVRELTSYGEHVYMALQNRRAHFFYAIGHSLYWLDTDPNVGMAAIEELLENPA